MLLWLGLAVGQMLEDDGAPDPLFFFQLPLPIPNPAKTVDAASG